MPAKKLESYVAETYRSTDPRDDGRQIRIVDVVGEVLRYRKMVESSVSPGTLVPNGRKGIISPATLRKSYEKVES
jgi:hypothetical protein